MVVGFLPQQCQVRYVSKAHSTKIRVKVWETHVVRFQSCKVVRSDALIPGHNFFVWCSSKFVFVKLLKSGATDCDLCTLCLWLSVAVAVSLIRILRPVYRHVHMQATS